MGRRKAYLVLIQPAELRDQTRERVFSWDGRSIRDEGVFDREAKRDEGRDRYRKPAEGDVRRNWSRVRTPHTEDVFIFVVLKHSFGHCLELKLDLESTYGVSEVTAHLRIPPALWG